MSVLTMKNGYKNVYCLCKNDKLMENFLIREEKYNQTCHISQS